MTKTLSRLVFALWIVGAPVLMIGCAEGEKPAETTPSTTEAPISPAPAAPGEGATPAPTPAPEPAK